MEKFMRHVRRAGGWCKCLVVTYKVPLGIVVATGFLLLAVPSLYANISTGNRRFTLDDMQQIPKRRVVIVFGAGVYKDGTPTPYLKWRINTAVKLFNAGKADKIVMSGDNSSKRYNEPVAMKKYAQELGVAEDAIVLDYAGLSTYDTCYRAKAIFGVNDAILVTQGYHLPRAVMTCKALGVDALGVAAKREGKDFTVAYILREYVSTVKAAVETVLLPNPILLGKPEPIR